MLSPGAKLGPYEIQAQIGAGGMGEVYRARDTRLNRDVAVKVLPELFARDTQRMARFEREAKVLASLNHPNIAAIYGIEESEPIHPGGLQVQPAPVRALVMELVEGPTLAERIRGGAIPLDEALPIARQIADAVEYAHDNNVIHRDLKPANIKVKADGTVKVLDFGLAKAMSDDPTEGDMNNSPTLSMAATQQGVILGTAAYMSPEQAKGKQVDRRTDVWAFGCVLYEMLAGKQVFSGDSVAETLASVMKEAPPFDSLPKDTPPVIRTLLSRCLEKSVRQRLAHIGEARILIEGVLSGAARAEPGVSQARERKGLFGNARLAWGMAAVLLIATVALSAWVVALRRPPAEPLAIRFSIEPPAQMRFDPNPQFLTISPDGTKLAFIATDASSRDQLWVRALDSETSQMLPGTDNLIQPFWSPDSRFLAFYAPDGKLKKVAASGGPVQTITESSSGANGSWSQDGIILFASAVEGPREGAARPGATIRRVSAAGGASTPVTTLDESRQETAHYWPHFLPDGRHFLYLALSSRPENSAIFVGSLDSPEKKLLLNALSNVVYVPPGYLLFNREGALMTLPFDAQRLELTGEEILVAEGVQFNPVNTRAAFAVSANGVLVYRTANTAAASSLTWYDRTGKQLGTLGEPALQGDLDLSPDGRRVAVNILDQTGRAEDIWIYDVVRGVRERLTFDRADEDTAVWSPDGSRVVFRSNRKGHYDLYLKAADGSGVEEPLLEDIFAKRPGSWSPDGQHLLYNNSGSATGTDLFVLPLSGDPSAGSGQGRKPVPFMQTLFAEVAAKFSPDGRWVAYRSDEAGTVEVYVAPFPGPGGKRQVSNGGGDWPRWRADGTEIFYRAPDNMLMVAAVNGRGPTFEIGAVKPLFQMRSAGTGHAYAVTADGQRFLVNTAPEEASAAPITVVVNWTAGLSQ
jgi:serine/threonine protein kinase